MYQLLLPIFCLITNVESYCHCGKLVTRDSKATDRIYKGKDVPEGRFPWQLYLSVEFIDFGKRSDFVYTGGAVLISKRHALSAAHNFFHPNISYIKIPMFLARLYAGFVDQTDPNPNYIQSRSVVKQNLLIYPTYKASQMHRKRAKYFFANDIALITLDEPFDISKRIINPICLPHKLDHIGEKWNNQQLIISGWGEYDKSKNASDILQSAIVKKVGNIYCYQKWYKYHPHDPNIVTDHKGFCVVGKMRETSTCVGDSGGPAIWEDPKYNNRAYLMGIAYEGKPVCGETPIVPSKFSSVPGEVMKWILKHGGEDVDDCLVKNSFQYSYDKVH